jgi:hypothetical protein
MKQQGSVLFILIIVIAVIIIGGGVWYYWNISNGKTANESSAVPTGSLSDGSWTGEYFYGEDAPPNEDWAYDLTVATGTVSSSLTINGFQTEEDFNVVPSVHGGDLVITLASQYGRISNQSLHPGDILLSLSKVGARQYAIAWQQLSPQLTSDTQAAIFSKQPICNDDFSTSSYEAVDPILGDWESTDGNSSFGEEVDFTNAPCDVGYSFRSYEYNPNTKVIQPSVWGAWSVASGTLTIVDFSASSYVFQKFSASTTTLILYGSDGSIEKYSRIKN